MTLRRLIKSREEFSGTPVRTGPRSYAATVRAGPSKVIIVKPKDDKVVKDSDEVKKTIISKVGNALKSKMSESFATNASCLKQKGIQTCKY